MTEWIEADSVTLRDYLDTPSGQKLMELLARPATTPKTFEEAALQSRFADGIDSARNIIKTYSVYRPIPQVLSTPPVNWNE